MPCARPTVRGVAAWLDCSELVARASPAEREARWRLEQMRWPTWKRLAYAACLAAGAPTVAWRGRRYEIVGVHQDRLVLRGVAELVWPQDVIDWRVEACARSPGTG